MDTGSGPGIGRTLHIGDAPFPPFGYFEKLILLCLQTEHPCQIFVTLKVDNSEITPPFPSQILFTLNNGTQGAV